MSRVLLSVLLVLLPALGTAEPLRVFVSVLPQQGFVERIGGEHVRVQAMVQPGHSPATYDPSPRQIAALAEAELYVRTGVPFERAWMKRIRAANPDMRVLDLREGIETRRLEAHTHDHDHDPGHEHAGHGGE
ncbi:MAG: zinc ABC transporter substrate-binding protein, partial [Chromatiales bacterium]